MIGLIDEKVLIRGEKRMIIREIINYFKETHVLTKGSGNMQKDGDDFSVFIVIDVMQRQIF